MATDFVSWLKRSLGEAGADKHLPQSLSPALQARREITEAAVTDLATNIGLVSIAIQKSNAEGAAHVLRRQAALAKRVRQVDAVAANVCGDFLKAKARPARTADAASAGLEDINHGVAEAVHCMDEVATSVVSLEAELDALIELLKGHGFEGAGAERASEVGAAAAAGTTTTTPPPQTIKTGDGGGGGGATEHETFLEL